MAQTGSEAKLSLSEEKKAAKRLDSTETTGLWYIVDAKWLKHWREYCWEEKRSDPPGPVSNAGKSITLVRGIPL